MKEQNIEALQTAINQFRAIKQQEETIKDEMITLSNATTEKQTALSEVEEEKENVLSEIGKIAAGESPYQ